MTIEELQGKIDVLICELNATKSRIDVLESELRTRVAFGDFAYERDKTQSLADSVNSQIGYIFDKLIVLEKAVENAWSVKSVEDLL